MKRILFLTITLLLLTLNAVAQSPAPSAWKRYTVKDEDFAVVLPTIPAMTTSKSFQPRLRKDRLERQLKTSLDGVVYSVDVFDNPKPKQSLEEFVAEQNANSTYDLSSERSLTIDGFAGKEYSSREKPGVARFFATERRLYRFAATGAGTDNEGLKTFLSSIMLGKHIYGFEVSDGPGMPLESETGDRIFKGSEVDTKPRLTAKPEPVYTQNALQKKTRGTVVLIVVLYKTGIVNNIQVVHGLPNGLTEAAIEAAKKIKFTPAVKGDKYVSMWMTLEYNFYF